LLVFLVVNTMSFVLLLASVQKNFKFVKLFVFILIFHTHIVRASLLIGNITLVINTKLLIEFLRYKGFFFHLN
jgi:hypothetical protein